MSMPPSRKPSVTTSRATSTQGVRPTSTLPPPPLLSAGSLSIPTQIYGKRASAGYAGDYEMQTYEGQIYDRGSERTSQTSHAFFATADDFWASEEGVSGLDYAYQHAQMLHSTPLPQLDAQSS